MRLLFFSAESGATMGPLFYGYYWRGTVLLPSMHHSSLSIRLMTSRRRRRRRDCLYLFSLPVRPCLVSREETTVVSCSLHPKDGWANGDLAAQDKSADFATHFTTTAIINRHTVWWWRIYIIVYHWWWWCSSITNKKKVRNENCLEKKMKRGGRCCCCSQEKENEWTILVERRKMERERDPSSFIIVSPSR